MIETPVFAGIELGGSWAVAVLARDGMIIDSVRRPTMPPGETLAGVEDWLAGAAARHGRFAALGIASFGPLGLNPARPGFGHITTTPKPGWRDVDLLARFRARFGVPTMLDTDVNGAALAEGRWGAAKGARVHAYVTIGTGVGAGIVVEGATVKGLVHPEFGHVRVRRVAGDDFAGTCPFHGDCLEGLISGPALAARAGAGAGAGADPATLPPDHPLWRHVVADLAEALAMLLLTVSPERIVIGGGVGLGQAHLLPAVRAAVAARLGGYLPAAVDSADGELICAAGLGDRAGALGAIMLAEQALAAG